MLESLIVNGFAGPIKRDELWNFSLPDSICKDIRHSNRNTSARGIVNRNDPGLMFFVVGIAIHTCQMKLTWIVKPLF